MLYTVDDLKLRQEACEFACIDWWYWMGMIFALEHRSLIYVPHMQPDIKESYEMGYQDGKDIYSREEIDLNMQTALDSSKPIYLDFWYWRGWWDCDIDQTTVYLKGQNIWFNDENREAYFMGYSDALGEDLEDVLERRTS